MARQGPSRCPHPLVEAFNQVVHFKKMGGSVAEYYQPLRLGREPGVAAPCEAIDRLLEGPGAAIEISGHERDVLGWKPRFGDQLLQRLLAALADRAIGCDHLHEH